MRWEYTVVIKSDSVDFMEALNQLGEQGWEAVSGSFTIGELESEEVPGAPEQVVPGGPRWVAVMKRQKSN